MKKGKVKKLTVFLAILFLITSIIFTVNLIRVSFKKPTELAYKNTSDFVYNKKDNIKFKVDYTNDKTLNKILEENISLIFKENSDVFEKKDKDIMAKLSIYNEKNLATWVFMEKSSNLSEIYGSLIFNTKNNEVIPVEKIYSDDFKGLSMLVRKSLAQNEELLFNKKTYTKTTPEISNFKYLNLDADGAKIYFKRDTFGVNQVCESELAYDEIMPYFSDEFLSFFSEGYTRPNNLSSRYIDPNKPMMALTFDDGPNYSTSKDLGEHFAANNGRVTFFWLGSRIEQNRELVLSMHNLGHEIANHSYDHKKYSTLNDEDLAFQTNGVTKIIKDITKQDKVVLRPPYGSTTAEVRAKIDNPLILWKVDPEDWRVKDEAKVFDHLRSHMSDGEVILMHDLYPTSVNAAKRLLDTYGDKYQFVTVSEMFAYKGIPLINGELYFDAKGR